VILPTPLADVLLPLAPAFSAPTFDRFARLALAAVLTTGRRTVANLLRTLRCLAPGHRTSYQRALSSARWSGLPPLPPGDAPAPGRPPRGAGRRRHHRRAQAVRHAIAADWRNLLDTHLENEKPATTDDPEVEERAREEKTAALKELAESRLSVLIGPAGRAAAAVAQVLVDDQDPILPPAQGFRPLRQLVLQVGRFAVLDDLPLRRLPHVW
jgi:hypothetical protein